MAIRRKTWRNVTGDRYLWPYGVGGALIAALAILAVLLTAVGLSHAYANWPTARWDSWVLIGILIITLVPVALLVLDRVYAAGGSVEVRGLKIVFEQRARSAPSVLVQNLNAWIPSDRPVVGEPSTRRTLSKAGQRAFREAMSNDVVLLDLGDGSKWWETRLLVLCAAAQRFGQVRAIVFVAVDHTVPRTFQGSGLLT